MNNTKPQGRHELKFMISQQDALLLEKVLSVLLRSDDYTDTTGRYQVHSLYFDNFANRAVEEKMCGTDFRTKYRIRWYNADTSFFHLECKQKIGTQCWKEKTRLSPQQVQEILQGNIASLWQEGDHLQRQFYQALTQQRLRPQTIVSYWRRPFVYPKGNVRITLDYDIRTSLHAINPLEPAGVGYPTLAPEELVLEVKYDQYLPEVIKELLQIEDRRQLAISKYVLCRQFG